MTSEKWWSTADLAIMLGISEATVRRRASAGHWPHKRIGKLYRFTDDNIQAIKEKLTPDFEDAYDSKTIARMLRSA